MFEIPFKMYDNVDILINIVMFVAMSNSLQFEIKYAKSKKI